MEGCFATIISFCCLLKYHGWNPIKAFKKIQCIGDYSSKTIDRIAGAAGKRAAKSQNGRSEGAFGQRASFRAAWSRLVQLAQMALYRIILERHAAGHAMSSERFKITGAADAVLFIHPNRAHWGLVLHSRHRRHPSLWQLQRLPS